eukprot:2747856-Rhodomonas_salina.1
MTVRRAGQGRCCLRCCHRGHGRELPSPVQSGLAHPVSVAFRAGAGVCHEALLGWHVVWPCGLGG